MDVRATLYLECASGASGDMLAAALAALCAASAAAGQDPLAEVVAPALAAAGIDPAVVTLREVRAGGLRAHRFVVDERSGFGTFAELVEAVRGARLDRDVRDGVIAVAGRMAAAERAVHGGDEERLHELAGIDTAVDLLAVLALVRRLAPARVVASPPALGGGTVSTAHGELPVPAPAVVALLEGLPTAGGSDADGELTTPTGAALLAELADGFGPLPAGRVLATGVGAGRRELAGRPNVLRAFLIDTAAAAGVVAGAESGWSEDEVELLEATIDDLSPELLADTAERLRKAGARDVWFTPVTMKKGRPGVVLHTLVAPARRGQAAEIVFAGTSTFGLRVTPVRRLLLDERREKVEVAGLTVRVRLGFLGGELVTAAPEYEDCRAVATRTGRPLRDVYREAEAAARALAGSA